MNFEKAQELAISYISEGGLRDALKASGLRKLKKGSAYYVYLLVNPKTDRIFYIGKGTKDRVSNHVSEAKRGVVKNVNKHKEIMKIIDDGLNVSEVIICNTSSEDYAYKIERVLINLLYDYGITNYQKGVTPEKERAVETAKLFKRKIKTFEEWLASANEYQIKAALSFSGGARKCYDAIVKEIDSYSTGDFSMNTSESI